MTLEKRGAELLFQVITKRNERGSIIISTNIAFKHWPRIFAGDAILPVCWIASCNTLNLCSSAHRRRQLPQRHARIIQPVSAYPTETSPVHF
jgi:DNA replication protein DnaC